MEEKIKDEQQEESEFKINLLDYVLILLRRKKLIITITLSVAILTVAYALFLPNIYVTEAKILPPQGQNWNVQSELIKSFGGASPAWRIMP